MSKAKRKKKPADTRQFPPAEQMARTDYVSAGMAVRRVPIIETMHKRGQLTEQEWRVLSYYRDQASLAESSPTRSCIDFSPKGSGNGPSAAVISARIETGRLERDMGAQWQIARAVAVNDVSLSQWCVARKGGRERYNGRGEFVAIVPVGEVEAMRFALIELKTAARRIMGVDFAR